MKKKKNLEGLTTEVKFYQHVYEKLLCTQIPKAPNYTANLTVFFVLLGSAGVKALSNMLMKLTTGFPCYSHQIGTYQMKKNYQF